MNDTDTIHHDDANAVVDDDGASIVAGSEVAYTGDIDKNFLDELRQAKADLGRFVEMDDEGRLGQPHFVKNGDIDFLAGHVARWHGIQPCDGLELLVDEAMIHFQVNRAARKLGVIGSVSLDLAPEGRFPQDIGHPTEPKVLFMAVDRNTPGTAPLYKAGEREYMAVWFEPNVTADGEPLDSRDEPLRPRGKTNRLYCDDFFVPGYRGIVDWFGSRALAKQAMRELQHAVRTIAKPPPKATIDDPMREELLAQYEADDASDGRNRRSQRPVGERVDPF
jgi:hypothetical protein